MSEKLDKVSAYVRQNWITPDDRLPNIATCGVDCALIYSQDVGILAILSHKAAMPDRYSQFAPNMRVTPLFYGDKLSFFRPAAGELVKKLEHRNNVGSLWHYDQSDIEQAVLLHPLEKTHNDFVCARNGEVYYFHPEPAMAQDVIAGYKFKPFLFDYTRHTNLPRDKPTHVYSKRYFAWKHTPTDTPNFVEDSFAVENGRLVSRARKKLELDLG